MGLRVELLKLKIRSPARVGVWGLRSRLGSEVEGHSLGSPGLIFLKVRGSDPGIGVGDHLLPLGHSAPPDVVTGRTGKLPVHRGDEVLLSPLEHA